MWVCGNCGERNRIESSGCWKCAAGQYIKEEPLLKNDTSENQIKKFLKWLFNQ